MDAVYILGNGSLSNNKEIVLSMRSLRKHMLDLRDIYIIGDEPPEECECIYIPFADEHEEKYKNAYFKTLEICKNDYLSDDFILMNDDFFVNEDFLGSELPYFALSGVDGGINGRHSYRLHKPVKFNKEAYSKMPFPLDMKGSWSPRSFYCNFYACPPTYSKDTILVSGKGVKPFADQIAGADFFSIDDVTMRDPAVLDFLEKLYPNDEQPIAQP